MKLNSYKIQKTLWIFMISVSLVLGYINCYFISHKIGLSFVLAPLMGLAILSVLYVLYLILSAVIEWGTKHHWMKFINTISLMIILIGSFFISQASIRFLSARYADPSSEFWEDAYYSNSPRATKYHYSKDCELLNSTKFAIERTYIEDAEKWMDLEPCKHCLKYSKKFKNDDFIFFLSIPVAIFFIYNYFRLLKISKNYKLQSPLVKRTN